MQSKAMNEKYTESLTTSLAGPGPFVVKQKQNKTNPRLRERVPDDFSISNLKKLTFVRQESVSQKVKIQKR